MKGLAFLLIFVFTACASVPAKNPVPPPAPVPAPAPLPEAEAPAPPAITPEQPEPDAELEQSSDLRNSISDWIAENPDAELEEAARHANRLMRRHGYPLVLDVSALLKPKQSVLRLKSGRRKFIFRAGKELSRTADVCGERFLRVPGRLRGPGQVSLVVKGKEYPISLKGIRRERFRVWKNSKVVSTLFTPEPTEPIGLAGNGKALYMKFPLNEELTEEWWQKQIAHHQPSVHDEIPYLVLRVEKGRLYFDENIEHVPAQEFEVDESDGSAFRWKFQPSGLVLELNSRCG
jgi:hypothetical protein